MQDVRKKEQKMSTNINTQSLKKFIMQTLNVGQKLDSMEAKKLGVLDEYNNAVGQDEIDISVEDVLDNEDLYAQFATMYTAEIEKNNEVDKEKEKEEQNKVNEKNEAKA